MESNLVPSIVAGPVDTLLKTLTADKLTSTILVIFLIVYGSLAAPKLTPNLAKVFDDKKVQFLVLVLIAYMSTRDTPVAIMAALAFQLTVAQLNKLKAEKFVEKFSSSCAPYRTNASCQDDPDSDECKYPNSYIKNEALVSGVEDLVAGSDDILDFKNKPGYAKDGTGQFLLDENMRKIRDTKKYNPELMDTGICDPEHVNPNNFPGEEYDSSYDAIQCGQDRRLNKDENNLFRNNVESEINDGTSCEGFAQKKKTTI
tara:strand:+ start:96 stop:869 length:774 start_codon:yes stop_codon:yes gene_type:complete